MRPVPKNWYANSKLHRRLLEEFPAFIGGFRPMPTGPYSKGGSLRLREVRYEVASEPELMRALERTRFRNSFSEEARLPLGEAESLENFEAELRRVGFIAVDEIIVQSLTRPHKFRVQKANVIDDRIRREVHLPVSSKAADANASSPVLTGDQKPPVSALSPVKGVERSVPLQAIDRMQLDLFRAVLKSPKGGA